MKTLILIFITFLHYAHSQGAWMMSNRTHPELDWRTIKTENFNIHYHEDIYEIALKGANIAEKVRPILMEQVGLKELKRLDIVFTAEDEVMNGFAVPANYTVIWVDQNDVAVWTEDEKWLRTVVAHELQHLVYFNVIKSWLPAPMDQLYGQTPSWVVEGLAEYYTEKWRPLRFDISHKYHTIKNSLHKIRDPHNDGFSKILYFADKYGDEKLVQILNHRDSLRLFNFNQAFETYTGTTIKQFEEDWRRQMSTYYFGMRAQKETYEDVGNTYALPMKYVYGFDWFKGDSTKIIMVGRLNKNQRDLSLVLAVRDTSKENERRKKLKEKGKKLTKKNSKPIWDLKELDYGRISNYVKSAPDGSKILYSKYGYGKNQSLTWDVFYYDIDLDKKERVTFSKRASNACWSPSSEKIAFVAHKNSSSNLFVTSISNLNKVDRITNYSGDVQIVTPSWSPDGSSIAYAVSKDDGNMDIVIFDLERKEPVRITDDKAVDYLPVWHPSGNKITYTSHSNMTPNFYTVDIKTSQVIQNTNVSGAISTVGWKYDYSAITGMTLGDVDSSRVVDIFPNRLAKTGKTNMNPRFSSWKSKVPDISIPDLDSIPDLIDSLESEKYSSFSNIKHFGTIFIPDNTGLVYNGAYSDATGREIFQSFVISDWENIAGGFGYLNATGKPFGGFWGFSFYKDVSFQERIFNRDKDYLIEFYNGLELFGYRNYNFGRSLSSNHNLRYSLTFFDREVVYEPDSLDVFNQNSPESGDEGAFSLTYTFINKRPELYNIFMPRNGYGLKLTANFVDKNIWGDFTYNHYEVDSYFNKKFGPLTIYSRARYENISGNPPGQETAGIIDIPTNYYAGQLIIGKEHMSPRGYSGAVLGTSAFMGTAELRSPLINLNVLEVFKIIKAGKISFSVISDYGKVWGSDYDDWIVTAGVESRISLMLGNFPLLVYSAGLAQTTDEWSNGKSFNDIEPYYRLALVNPF